MWGYIHRNVSLFVENFVGFPLNFFASRPKDRRRIFIAAHNDCLGAASTLKPREIPQVRKITALLWFYTINPTVISFEKNALPIRFVLKRKSLPIACQPCKFLHEVEFADVQKLRRPRDLGIAQPYLPGPAAARGATIAFEKYRHWRKMLSARAEFKLALK